MKLHGAAQHQLLLLADLGVSVAGKQHVHGRYVLVTAPLAHGPQQQRAGLIVAREQARARHGREGHGDHGLGVVGHAMLFVGAGPGPVKDVFAIGMALQVQRAGGHQGVAFPQRHEAGCPAGAGRGTAAALQRRQVFMPHEGRGVALLGQQAIPGRSVHVQRGGEHAGDNVSFSHAGPCDAPLMAGLQRRYSTRPQGPIPVP